MPKLSEATRRAIANDVLLHARGGSLAKLGYGTFNEFARKYQCNVRTVARVWKRFKSSVAAGNIARDVSSRIKGRSGRKGYNKSELATAMKAVPIEERRTIATTATAVGVSSGVIQWLLRDCVVKRATSRIKPLLTPQNQRERMEYALALVDENNLFFEPMHDVVHVDEMWFYEDEVKHTYYVVGDEEVPQRHRRSKRFIEKTMFWPQWLNLGNVSKLIFAHCTRA
ncbi:unnamed protein product [Phytophthora fragariaefolia]|uniref:Unnamed protein product n=1 Tax=Phytophthora fragariaefolia TaxID=1490495 RepID=A0A9W6UD34_9STRA|nr:unnamed protein product [Phytophthora fragariaefolia]